MGGSSLLQSPYEFAASDLAHILYKFQMMLEGCRNIWLIIFARRPLSFLMESFFTYRGNRRTLVAVFCHMWHSSDLHFIFSHYICGFLKILHEFHFYLFELQNLHFYGWKKIRDGTIFIYPQHDSTESASLQIDVIH